MSRELSQSAYTEYASDVATLLSDPGVNRYEHLVVWPEMEAMLPPNPRSILDFGCGSGYFTRLLATRYPEAEVIGTDSSKAMVAEAAQPEDTIEWQAWDGITRPPDSWQGKFDLVVCKMVLHYIADLERAARNLAAVTAPLGRIVISVPHPGDTMHLNARKKIGDEYDYARQYHSAGVYQREIGRTGLVGTMFHRKITDWMEPFHGQGLGMIQFEEPCQDGKPKRLLLSFECSNKV